MREFTLAAFAAFCAEELSENVEHAKESALEFGARAIQHEARRVIGTYDYGWPELAPATQADREKKGYAPDEPLLRDGTLRDSIKYTVINKEEAEIGSDSDIAVYQELGTATIPARSFLAGAAVHKGKAVAHAMGDLVAAAVESRNVAGEIAKLAIEVAHDLVHDANELLEGDEDEHHR